MTLGPRIYNLFPLLVGSVHDWSGHLARIAGMQFDWVFLNPIHYPGFSGSLYAVKDPYRLHDRFQGGASEHPDDLIRGFCRNAREKGLRVMLDLVVNHTAKDAVLAEQHPDWYRREADGSLYSPRAVDPVDPSNVTIWGDLAELDYENEQARAGLVEYWANYVRHHVGLGVKGFRCDAAYQVPAPVWRALIDAVLAERTPAPPPEIFASTVLGGWEASTHRLGNGRRLDVIAAVGHDRHAAQDYRQLAGLGIRACRDGARWHLIETAPGRYDFSSLTPMMAAARDSGTQVVWDLLHYGWPDDLDIWTPAFVNRFAAYARAVALHHRDLTDAVPFWCPVNEISFFAWAGGDARYLNPFCAGRGYELKCQLARAAIAAMTELRAVDPRARFVHSEPLIAIHHDPATGRPLWEAQGWHDAQFQAFELVSGRVWPQLGGDPSFLDIVGLNYYWNNQWIHGGPPIDMDHGLYRPLSDLLVEVAARYDRPLLIAETGTEGPRRASWFAWVMAEVDRARARGAPVEGVCLYPIANHPGWDDDRPCPNGLLGADPSGGARAVEIALAHEIARLSGPAAGNIFGAGAFSKMLHPVRSSS